MEVERISSSEYEDMTGWDCQDDDVSFWVIPADAYHNRTHTQLTQLVSAAAGEHMSILSSYFHIQSGSYAVKAERRVLDMNRESHGELKISHLGIEVEVITNNRGTPEIHIITNPDKVDVNGAPCVFVTLDGDSIYECQD